MTKVSPIANTTQASSKSLLLSASGHRCITNPPASNKYHLSNRLFLTYRKNPTRSMPVEIGTVTRKLQNITAETRSNGPRPSRSSSVLAQGVACCLSFCSTSGDTTLRTITPRSNNNSTTVDNVRCSFSAKSESKGEAAGCGNIRPPLRANRLRAICWISTNERKHLHSRPRTGSERNSRHRLQLRLPPPRHSMHAYALDD